MSFDKRSHALFLIVLLAGPSIFCVAQESKVNYFEVIKDDSVVVYYSHNSFCPLKCASFQRYTRVTPQMEFDGSFSEININNGSLSARGVYKKGKKNGYFESYFADGRIQSKGSFENDIPIGDWFFFHPNGIVERQLRCTATDTLLVTMLTAKGKVKVMKGNGQVNAIAGIERGGRFITFYRGHGEIKYGKPDGVWKISERAVPKADENSMAGINPELSRQPVLYREEWKDGKFVKGKFINANSGATDEEIYAATRIKLFPEPQYVQAEHLKVRDCDILDPILIYRRPR